MTVALIAKNSVIKFMMFSPDNSFFLAATSGTTGQPKIYLRDWLSWKSGFETINDLFQLKKIESLATA